MISRLFLGALVAATLLVVGCDQQSTSPPTSLSQNQPQSTGSISPRGANVRYALFLNRMRSTEPQQKLIEKAIINEKNQIGVILDRSVEPDKVSDAMRTVLDKMGAEFSGENLTVYAYAASDPTHSLGFAKLNAQTHEVAYTPGEGETVKIQGSSPK